MFSELTPLTPTERFRDFQLSQGWFGARRGAARRGVRVSDSFGLLSVVFKTLPLKSAGVERLRDGGFPFPVDAAAVWSCFSELF